MPLANNKKEQTQKGERNRRIHYISQESRMSQETRQYPARITNTVDNDNPKEKQLQDEQPEDPGNSLIIGDSLNTANKCRTQTK